MPNYQGVWSLSEQYQNASGWPVPPASPIGLFGGGYDTGASNVIQSILITTLGNSTDFGDLSVTFWTNAALSSSVRGVFGNGRQDGSSPGNRIEFVTFASAGNSTDFGDTTVAVRNSTGCSSSTRGIFMGGANSSNTRLDVMDYITIASASNATDFGNLTAGKSNGNGSNSSTRGIYALGYISAITNVIEYVTIASAGNGTDFGDATVARLSPANGVISSGTRGVFAGGDTNVVVV